MCSGKRIYTFPEYAILEIWDQAHKCLHISFSPYIVPYLWLSLNWTLAKVVTALANVVPVLAPRSALAFMTPQQGQILPKIFSRSHSYTVYWHYMNIHIGKITYPEIASFLRFFTQINLLLKLEFPNLILTRSLSYPHTAHTWYLSIASIAALV